jgi:hypothetical protein
MDMVQETPMPMDDEPQKSGMVREAPEIDQARRAQVGKWQDRIVQAKKFHDSTFQQMRADMDFAGGEQWVDQSSDDERYVANFVQRHIQQRTASLYAKNPRFFFKRKRKLDFKVWDGRPESLQEAIAGVMQAQQGLMANPQMALDPAAVQMGMAQIQPHLELLQDVEEGRQRQRMAERIGKTLELLAEYEVGEQKPPFKKQMKQLIRRVLTCKVGYLKLGFERIMRRRPEDAEKIRDFTQKLSVLDQLIADAQDGECTNEKAEHEQMRVMLEDLQSSAEEIVREGLVFDFPPSTSVIIDPACRQLQGFVGARWIAQEFQLHVDVVKQTYNIDLKASSHTAYTDRKTDFSGMLNTVSSDGNRDQQPGGKDLCVVWEIQDKESGMVFTIADGYPDYLRAPERPEIELERFWTIFALTFNDLENDRRIFPPSDVQLLRHAQLEHNRSREALREHRIAARPATVSTVPLDDEDKEKLKHHPANAVLELVSVQGAKVQDVLQPLSKPGVDPNLYTTDHLAQDRAMVTGAADASIGLSGNGATATADSIAEGSRMTSVGSNVDDLDDFLQEIGHAMGHVLLTNVSAQTAMEVCGPGAVWPELSSPEIARDLILDVEAGSSGRPNRASEIANAKEIFPLLIQVPGIDPKWMAKQLIQRLDDKINVEEAFLEGMPPIASLARMMTTPLGGGAPAAAEPGSDPAQQGGAGANNAPRPPGSEMQGPPSPADLAPGGSVREPFRSNMAPRA